MYYLQSWYYDPELGRFISRDDPVYHEGETGAAANLYAYCINPVIVIRRTTDKPSKIREKRSEQSVYILL
ncbi:MAG: hypothetical protein PHH84_09120 [Oscillospiraceae bacterium]|nr:hypothetical protein [Oscillospiraceae bacterium]MDD4414401.1 hypothetical protein [Oscillospiraceae bacterium]